MWQCATYADAPAEWGGGTFVEELYPTLQADGVGGQNDTWGDDGSCPGIADYT